MSGNPIVVAADARLFLQCVACAKHITKANADMVFGGETQLWPEISDYFKRDAEKALKNELSHSLGDIGKAEGVTLINKNDIPNGWPNASRVDGEERGAFRVHFEH